MWRRLLVVAAIAVLVAACTPVSIPLPNLDGTEPAPDITLPTLEGGSLSLADLRGKVVFINFWGTYCPPCVDELPVLQALHEDYAGKDLVVLGVNVEEKPAVVEAWTRQHGITFPTVLSDDGTVNPLFNLRHMPTTWFVDADGILRGKMIGQMDERTARRIADNLLNEH